MTNAYNMVREKGVSVYSAAKRHGIPLTTLRDRIDNRVSIDVTKSGPGPVLSLEEEAQLCNHLKELAAVGYGYTRAEVINLASDYAVSIGKRSIDKPFTQKWFYGYMGRWPELKVVRPSSLSEQRARCASEEAITNYFNELERIMTKYNLKENPQNIYNIDEKGINTEFKPPNVVSGMDCKPQVLPPHTSHILQPMDVGCFGPLQIKYSQECTKFARLNHRVNHRSFHLIHLTFSSRWMLGASGHCRLSTRKNAPNLRV